MAVITRCSIAGSTEVQAACRRATKSICVVTTSRYTSSLRWPHRKNSNGVRSGECFKHYRLERYANTVVDMSNKVFFSCTGSDVILCFSYFSRKLWIVQERFFGQFLCTPNEESSCAELCGRFGPPCI
ncbi:hypothetical protein AVEN_91199-1 [Araneus ventricosus]|uniref:Uncharacterized protein n=1 Tax=Araneus ventricosus TaxID=182803 RepID=A0A4Y2SHE0_ARAVE|nr:hypothetical protein AVEN_91199-1 [Araneus ventricosus]